MARLKWINSVHFHASRMASLASVGSFRDLNWFDALQWWQCGCYEITKCCAEWDWPVGTKSPDSLQRVILMWQPFSSDWEIYQLNQLPIADCFLVSCLSMFWARACLGDIGTSWHLRLEGGLLRSQSAQSLNGSWTFRCISVGQDAAEVFPGPVALL